MRYFDSSAIVKMLVAEAESEALQAHTELVPMPARTSAIAITEVGIAISAGSSLVIADHVLRDGCWLSVTGLQILTLPCISSVLVSAARIGAAHKLRTLDAIHVATALALLPGLTEVVTYDRRMADACAALGILVIAPH